MKRNWTWIGHQLQKDPENITRQALRWNPQRKKNKDDQEKSWRRSVEDEMTSEQLQLAFHGTATPRTQSGGGRLSVAYNLCVSKQAQVSKSTN